MIDQSTLAQVDDKAQQYMNNPQALQQMYQQKQQLIDLLALQKIKSLKEAAARDMQLQMAQQSGQPQTIAQQREQQVLDMTKQEMVGQRAGTLGQQQQEQQRNLQQVLKGMSQGAPQPPQQGTPGVPQMGTTRPQSAPPQVGGQPGLTALNTQGVMPPKAMAAGGIVAFDEGGEVEDWEKEWRRRQRQLGGKDPIEGERPKSWAERMIYDPEEGTYNRARRNAVAELNRQEQPGMFTPTTKAERDAYLAKEAIIKNLHEGKYDPTGKPLVPMIGKEKQSDVFARMEAMKKGPQAAAPTPNTQADPNLNRPQPRPQPRPDAAPNLNTAAPINTMPQAPAGGLQSIVEQATQKQLGRDPVAEAAAKRAEAQAAMGYNPEEKAKFEANQAGLEALNKAQMDPEKLRKQQLEDFLLGAAGRSTAGMTLGAAGKAAVARERQQDALKYDRMGELAKRGEDYIESGRKAREEGFKVGEKTAEQAELGTRQGLASGTSMVDMDKQMVNAGLDRASREKIAALEAQVRRETNAATKEGTLELKRQTLLSNIDKAEENAVTMAKKGSNDYATLKNLAGFEAMGKLDKDQMAQKQLAEANLDKLEISIRNKFQDTRAMVMSGNSDAGLGSLSTGGWKVTPVKK